MSQITIKFVKWINTLL